MKDTSDTSMTVRSGASTAAVRLLAFYLPQFHPIPENDQWWGKGFTEWTNVARARPLFPGHRQPHLPSDLGFYDLRLPEAREAQAALAQAYGIFGFCYYHYWFHGRRLLNRPFDEVLASGRPQFPFCLCWANENWTRAWDGAARQVLMPQQYSAEDDLAHIEHLLPAFEDSRYFRVDGKPLFLVYRTELLPNPAQTAEIWRRRAKAAGIGDLYLARVEGFTAIDPATINFDAAIEFAPDWSVLPRARFHRERWDLAASILHRLGRIGLIRRAYLDHAVYPYDLLATAMLQKPAVAYRRFRCATPGWDNSPRRPNGAQIFRDSSPDIYERWLRTLVRRTCDTFQGDERLVFLNAWNEWGEGSHLEPDHHWGRLYLESTALALDEQDADRPVVTSHRPVVTGAAPGRVGSSTR
jgi:lipopolysaccharide biosynthesis protein